MERVCGELCNVSYTGLKDNVVTLQENCHCGKSEVRYMFTILAVKVENIQRMEETEIHKLCLICAVMFRVKIIK